MAGYNEYGQKKISMFIRILAMMAARGFIRWGCYNIVKVVPILNAFREVGVTPAARILSEIFKCCYPFALAVAGIFLAFSDGTKAAGFAGIARVLYAVSAVMNYVDLQEVRNYKDVRYPSYLDNEPKKSLVENIDCDYEKVDQINVECYEVFRGANFKGKANVEVLYKEDMTDSFGVEVIYRGTQCRLSTGFYEYDYEDDEESEDLGETEYLGPNTYKAYIGVYYEDSHDYDLRPWDLAMMYKYREDIRYSYSYVLEKINIYTAYPEKFDTSRVYGY